MNAVHADTPGWRHPAALIAAGLVLLKVVYLASPNLFPEEAYYWLYARHLDFGYLDHPPMVAWLIALGTHLFGTTEFGVRFFAVVCSLLTTFFACRLTDLLYGRRAAVYAVLLAQVLPFYFLTGFVMTPDPPLTACWAGMLYYLARVIFAHRAGAWLGVGIFLGLGMLSKYTVALLGPATLLILALDPPSRVWFRRAAPYLAVALSVLIFSPVIWWNKVHYWASFAFQTTGRTQVHRHFALHELAGTIVAVLTPVGLWLAISALANARGATSAGALPAPEESARRRLFARVYTLVPLAVFVAFSLAHRVKLNWTGPLWLAVIPAIAARLAVAGSNGESRIIRVAWNATVAVCVVAYALCLHHLARGIPGVKFAKNIALMPVGWPELARSVDEQKASLERSTRGPVYVVGMDRNFVASELSFYQADQARAVLETTGAHLFGGDSLMYHYWFPPARYEGTTLLLVSLEKGDLNSRRVLEHASYAEPPRAGTIVHRGVPIRPYYTQVVRGYREF